MEMNQISKSWAQLLGELTANKALEKHSAHTRIVEGARNPEVFV